LIDEAPREQRPAASWATPPDALDRAGVRVTTAESRGASRARKTAAEARPKPRRLQEAIAAGANPIALVDMINQAQAELEAAQAEQAQRPAAPALRRADVYAMIDYLGDVGSALTRADPTELRRLYEALNLEIIYHADQKAAEVAIRPGRDSARVRGASCTLTTRLDAGR
jgi:hypothetical protein